MERTMAEVLINAARKLDVRIFELDQVEDNLKFHVFFA